MLCKAADRILNPKYKGLKVNAKNEQANDCTDESRDGDEDAETISVDSLCKPETCYKYLEFFCHSMHASNRDIH